MLQHESTRKQHRRALFETHSESGAALAVIVIRIFSELTVKSLNGNTCCIAAHQLLQRRALQRKTGVRCETQHRRETILPCNNEKNTVQKGVLKAVMISNSTKFQPAELHLQRSEKFHSLLALKHVCFCFDQGQNTIDMPAQ